MKKLTALILAALLLTSCTKDKAPEIPVTEVSDYAAAVENTMEPSHAHTVDVEFQTIRGFISTSMTLTAGITEYLDEREAAMSTTAPLVTIAGEKTFIVHRYPPEVIASGPKSEEEWLVFALEDRIQDYPNEILVYTGHDYDAEPEKIPLTGLDQRYIFASLDYDAVRDTFTLSTDPIKNAETGLREMQIMEFDGSGALIRRTTFTHPGLNFHTRWHFIGEELYFNVQQETMTEQDSILYNDLDANFTLYRCDPWTGDISEILTDIRYFTAQDDKILYMTRLLTEDFQWEQALMCYDPADGTTEKLGEILPDNVTPFSMSQIYEAGYDSASGILYFSGGSGIKAYRPGDEEAVTILAKAEPETNADTSSLEPLQITDSHVVVKAGNHQMLIYETENPPLAVDANYTPLNFCTLKQPGSVSDLHAGVFRLMEMSGYPAKAVVAYEEENADEYAFTMAKKLLAGDTDFDIFYVTTEMSQLLKEGYYENLAQYDILDEIYASMIPGVKRLCTVGNTPALYPLTLNISMMRQTIDAEIPAAYTALRDYSGSDPLLAAYNLRNLSLPWFEQFAANYMARDMDDHEAKADLTALYETTLALADTCTLGDGFTGAKTVLRITQNLGKNTGIPANTTALPMLPLTENYLPAVEGSFYAVNPNSPNKELAAVFLAGMAYRDGDSNLYDTWREDMTYPDGSGTLFALYKSQIASGVRAYGLPDLMELLTVHFDALEAGEMTPADAAEEMLRYVKMVKYE